MKLLLRRDQRAAMLGGKPVFMLDVRADISAEEKATIAKYKLGDTMLYQSHELTGGSGLLGAASKLAFKAVTINVSVPDPTETLVRGYRVRVSHASVSPEEAKARRDALARVISKSLDRQS